MLPLLTFTTLVQRFAASAQSAATAILDFTVGSILRAVAEANASIALWMQWLIVLLLAQTRAATCVGSALDSWMADFGLTRLPSVASTGQVTFSRYTPTTSALVPVGAQVKTADGTQTFAVIADATQATWNAALLGYLIPAATASAVVTVQDTIAGTAGNVLANTISLTVTTISGVDTVNNGSSFSNGVNAESDAAFRARFANYMATLAKATTAAVAYAISTVQQGLSWTIQENINTSAVYTPGTFVVTIDDGSGDPPSSLLTAVGVAIQAVRPVGSVVFVQACSLLTVNAILTITVVAPGVKTTLQPLVQTALTAYVNAQGMGGTVGYFNIPGVALGVDPTITRVESFTLNSGTVDITTTPGQRCVAGTITVN